jgi:ribonuclease HI
MASKQKYYVVWNGQQPGIYNTWAECQMQIKGYANAKYKSFATSEEAAAAYEKGAPTYATAKKRTTAKQLVNPPSDRNDTVLPLPHEVEANAIAVDAACSGNPGAMEYRGVDLRTGQEVFHLGPLFGTNNIGEFLAIVHAVAKLTKEGRVMTVYSDSHNGILWYKGRKCKTKLARNSRTEQVFALVSRAEKWLSENPCNIKVKKWETHKWGEIPADFGRK